MILNLFFLFSNNTGSKSTYKISDLVDVRQGKLILDKDTIDPTDENFNKRDGVNVLTLTSVVWELNTIKPEFLQWLPKPKTIPSKLSKSDYIINRVGQTKWCSLLESSFDFEKEYVIPSHHFLILSPRKIILDYLPFFHAVLDIAINQYITKKEKEAKQENEKLANKPKLPYVTVNEIQNIEIEIPTENFDLLISQFNITYSQYASSYKNYITSKESLNYHKRELSKILNGEYDGNSTDK